MPGRLWGGCTNSCFKAGSSTLGPWSWPAGGRAGWGSELPEPTCADGPAPGCACWCPRPSAVPSWLVRTTALPCCTPARQPGPQPSWALGPSVVCHCVAPRPLREENEGCHADASMVPGPPRPAARSHPRRGPAEMSPLPAAWTCLPRLAVFSRSASLCACPQTVPRCPPRADRGPASSSRRAHRAAPGSAAWRVADATVKWVVGLHGGSQLV